MSMSSHQNRTALPVLLALSLLAIYLSVSTGVEKISLWGILSENYGEVDEVHRTIFYKLRLPRTALAYMAGAALSVSGMVFQAIFRNPLATPFTLGVSSGAWSGTHAAPSGQ